MSVVSVSTMLLNHELDGLTEQFFERYEPYAFCGGIFLVRVWIARDDVLDAEPFHAAGHFLRDRAEGKQTDRALLQALNRPPGLPFPVAGPRRATVLRELPDERHEQRHSMIGDFVHAPVTRDVGDDDIPARRFVDIHDIDADSITGDDLASLKAVDRPLSDLRVLSQHRIGIGGDRDDVIF